MSTILKIFHDPDSESPRSWDNLGTMACWHSRYSLGDEQPNGYPIDYMEDLVDSADPGFAEALEEEAEKHFETWGGADALEHWGEYRDEKVHEAFDKYFISLPLYLYDHSGLSISTGAFSCPWDSGQVGFIYISRKDAEKELYPADSYPREFINGNNVKWYGSLDTHVEAIFKAQVETYDQYLRGDVYGFVLEEDGEEVDACWGFYGSDWRENGITGHVDIDKVDEVWYMEPSMRTVMEPADKEILNEQ